MNTRHWFWAAHYEDGLVLYETGEENGPRFEDVKRDRLARFGLFDPDTGWPVVELDCATGEFALHGHRIAFRMGDVPLTGRARESYQDVVQFKSAHADWRPGGSSGTVVDAVHLGYRAKLPEALFRVVLRLQVRTGAVSIEASLARLNGRGPWGSFAVLVDGVEVGAGEDFAAAVGLAPGEP